MNQGDYIKGLIRERKLTSIKIAKKMGISKSTFSNKLNGHRPFKRHEIEILLKELDLTYEAVFKTKEVKIRDTKEHIIILDGERIVVPKEISDKLKEIMVLIEEGNYDLKALEATKEFKDFVHDVSRIRENFDSKDYKKLKKERAKKNVRKEQENDDNRKFS